MTRPYVTLTFDNGPTPGVTEPVLDLLAAHAVPATFLRSDSRWLRRKAGTSDGESCAKDTGLAVTHGATRCNSAQPMTR